MNLNLKSKQANTYDAIVVGTGISGGWAAKELTEKGLNTLVLERGRMVKHGDYPTATKDPWELPYVSNEPNWTPAFFDQDQAVTVMDIVDIIIPKTDTPGALEVGVPKFIESMVQDIYEENRQTEFREGLGEFISSVESEHGSPFIELDKETKVIIVTSLNKAAVNHTNEGVKEKFYMTVKELSVSGFCLSEAVATQVLKYDKVPGEYQGCVPFEEVGRTWAT